MFLTWVLLLTVLFPSLRISLISLAPVFITCGVYVPFDDLSPRRFFLPWFMPLSVHALTTVTRYLWAYQSVLNAAACLIAHLPHFSHISTFMTEDLHWLPLTAQIQFKILFLTCKTFLGQAPCYLCDLIRWPISAISGRPPRSLDHHDLLVPWSWTT